MTLASESVLRHIEAGAFDKQLKQLIKTAEVRLLTLRARQTTADFGVGDKVTINELYRTNYVHGHIGSVVSKSRSQLIVKLDQPVGRFSAKNGGHWEGAELRVSPAAVDLV